MRQYPRLYLQETGPKGDIITYFSRVAKVGTTSITVYVKVMSEIHKTTHVDGFLTFVCVDPETEIKRPHRIEMDERPTRRKRKSVKERAGFETGL